MTPSDKANRLLHDFKKDSYFHGEGVLCGVGGAASKISKKAILFRGTSAFIKTSEYAHPSYSRYDRPLYEKNPGICSQWRL